MLGSASHDLPLEPHIYSVYTLTHSYLVGRSMVVGHIPMAHTCSLMCTNHKDMTSHTQAFITELGTSHIYLEHSTAGHSLVSYLWSNAGRIVTHPCINWPHDCLTSVIKHKTFTPCYVSSPHGGSPFLARISGLEQAFLAL